MSQTAVEWYNSKVIELMTQREQGNIDVLEFRNQLDLLFEQAKEMEKKQNYNLDNLRDAYRWGTTVNIGTSDHFEEFLHNIKKKIK